MDQSLPETQITRVIQPRAQQAQQMDQSLPEWARRSNPVVRRHLGAYWKTLVPDMRGYARIILAQIVLLLLAIPFPVFLFAVLMPAVTVSLVMVPVGLLLYLQILRSVIRLSVGTTVHERANGTLPLLRATPRPFIETLMSKAAASVWRSVEDLNVVLLIAAFASLPALIMLYYGTFMETIPPVIANISVMIGLVAVLARLILEPAMVAALGVLLGAAIGQRNIAVAVTTAVALGYFAIINLLRLVAFPWPLQLIIELVLPVVMPIVIAWLALRGADYLLTRD
ncbi:MAG: hypothetical protein GYB67_09480 [Chloroflexi bacterium]|nr:hypothetical protein [Chloroflexota bacterium]